MGTVPQGVTPEEWQQAREDAALAEIEMLKARGEGFYASRIMTAFLAGLCDTSGNVAAFLSEDPAHSSKGE
jgi:hypothetical protein